MSSKVEVDRELLTGIFLLLLLLLWDLALLRHGGLRGQGLKHGTVWTVHHTTAGSALVFLPLLSLQVKKSAGRKMHHISNRI